MEEWVLQAEDKKNLSALDIGWVTCIQGVRKSDGAIHANLGPASESQGCTRLPFHTQWLLLDRTARSEPWPRILEDL